MLLTKQGGINSADSKLEGKAHVVSPRLDPSDDPGCSLPGGNTPMPPSPSIAELDAESLFNQDAPGLGIRDRDQVGLKQCAARRGQIDDVATGSITTVQGILHRG